MRTHAERVNKKGGLFTVLLPDSKIELHVCIVVLTLSPYSKSIGPVEGDSHKPNQRITILRACLINCIPE